MLYRLCIMIRYIAKVLLREEEAVHEIVVVLNSQLG